MRVNAIPDEAAPVKDGIIVRGKATGHAHRLREAGAVVLALGNAMYIRANQPAAVVHEEHGPIILPAGCWEVRRQREYEPAGWRTVVD